MTTVQVGDVTRPLMAVSQVCDKGNYVLFTSEGGTVLNLHDWTCLDFDRYQDIYTMDWYLKSEDANGKQRKPSNQSASSGGMLQSFKDIVIGGLAAGRPGFPRQGQ